MFYDNNNLFVKILCGELLCVKVVEDDVMFVIMDLMLQVDGYVFVILKELVVQIFELFGDVVVVGICMMQCVVVVVCVVFELDGVFIGQFNGVVVGQMVLYVYFYVILCWEGVELWMYVCDVVDVVMFEVFVQCIWVCFV